MDSNLLGNNIKHLRLMHKERLEDLGAIVHCAKSTIVGYEKGDRRPEIATLQKICTHYGITVDLLVNTDLSWLGDQTFSVNSARETIQMFQIMLPLFCSDEAMNNANFKLGYEKAQELISGFLRGDAFPGTFIERLITLFIEAADETQSPEAAANILWTLFLWWKELIEPQEAILLQSKLVSGKLTSKDFINLRDSKSEAIKKQKKSFITDTDPIIIETLRELKSTPKWTDLADYYLALRYVFGLIDTGLSDEQNREVGMQMMLSFMTLGNGYAFNFIKLGLAE